MDISDAFQQGLRIIARNPPKSNEVKKLKQEVRRLKDQINKDSRTIIEMQYLCLVITLVADNVGIAEEAPVQVGIAEVEVVLLALAWQPSMPQLERI